MTDLLDAVVKAVIQADQEAPQLGDILPPGEAVTIRVAGVQGEQGPQGEQGDPGADGSDGATGPSGPRGPEGLQGIQGDIGLRGVQGIKGDKGAKGDKGDKGDAGSEGQRGAKGDRGPVGPSGSSLRPAGGTFRSGGGSALTVKDEGSNLDTAVESLNFVGAGVTATNVGHAVTVTIPGGGVGTDDQTAAEVPFTPAGTIAATDVQAALEELDSEKAVAASAVMDGDAAGGDLGGLYPNPSVTDDSHAHTASTLPALAPTNADYLVGTANAGLSNEIAVGTTPGGELGGTWASPTVDATHSGSTHAAAQAAAEATAASALAAHTGDTSDAHDASAISVVAFGSIAATDVQAALEEIVSEASSGAPTTADYLVGTAQGGLSAEIVVGTSPGGELGGTWASPTVDATHSGSTHAATQSAAEATAAAALSSHAGAADPHTGYVLESLLDAKGDLIAASADNTPAKLTVGADDTILMADAAAGAGLKWVAAGTPSTQAFGDTAVVGTSDTFTRGDHKHAMPADPVTAHAAAADPHAGYVLESLLDAKGDLISASADNTPIRLAVGANDLVLTADSAASSGLKWAATGGTAADNESLVLHMRMFA